MAGKPPRKSRKTTSLKQDPAQPAANVTPMEHAPRTAEIAEIKDRKTPSLEREIEEQIRARAYELFVERGRQEGHDREDWERAQAEILSKYQREKSA
ncbi:MAG TPA: DUF2934 domain-containing protein [Candidatus Angelobacter sp.]|jgi:hypothetical protein|nr:DUF2934 domain-containing protein [Candidatus Angelobacter sp.]